jgi:cell division protein FtsB
MAISTQTEALIELYNQKVSLDTQQIFQVNYTQSGYTIQTGTGTTEKIRIWGSQEVIENYNYPIKKLDNRIIELNLQIQNLQTQLLVTKQTANDNGCPGFAWTTGLTTTTAQRDNLNYVGYTFVAPNPFSTISGILTTSNSGIGTYNYITQSGIGSYFGPILNVGGCSVYFNQIEDLEEQIEDLQDERNELISKVNILKAGKIQPELQNYAYEQSKNQINASISNSNAILTFLEDPANAQWL